MSDYAETCKTFHPRKINWKGWAITVGTFALFVITLSVIFDWKTSLMFSVLIFIHEMGHLVFCWRKQAMTTPPIFIPFVGAVIKMDTGKFDAVDEAEVGYGGPLFGSVAAAITLLIWFALPSRPDYLLVSSVMALAINFINLVPLRPLDGGRIAQVISGWFRYLGLLMILAIVVVTPANVGTWMIIALIIYSQDENGQLFKCIATLLTGAAMVVALKLDASPKPIMWYAPIFMGYLYGLSLAHLYRIKTRSNQLDKQEKEITASNFDIGDGILELEEKMEEVRDRREKIEIALHGTQKPLPAAKVRLKWLAYYLLLGASLLVLVYLAAHSFMESLGLSFVPA